MTVPSVPAAEFVGFVGRRTRVWLALLVPLCLFWSLVAASFAGEVARSLEFVSVDAVRLAADTSVGWLPALAALFAIATASRRAARATITPDHALIRPLRLPWPVYTIPLVDVVARRSTPSGVLLSAPALDRIRPPWERIEYLVDFRIVPAGLDEVASCLGHVPDPLLRGVLDGTASVRCFSASSGWGRLLVRVERGRVVSAVADPGHSALAPCLTCAFREWEPDRFVRLGPRERPSVATGPLPSLVDARAALRAVEGGASLESATATWSTTTTTERLPANRRR